mgnify:CR=1 FL=1
MAENELAQILRNLGQTMMKVGGQTRTIHTPRTKTQPNLTMVRLLVALTSVGTAAAALTKDLTIKACDQQGTRARGARACPLNAASAVRERAARARAL